MNVHSTHRDSEGCLRVANRFGFNSFATSLDAEKYCRALSKRRKPYWIIELEDGTFDFTMREPEPERPRELGGYLRTVKEGTT